MGAFENMVRLQEIVIPDTVTYIGPSAFSGCTHLTKVVLPNGLKQIPGSCFKNTALSEINIPDTVEIIGRDAFATPCSLFGYSVVQGKLTEIDVHQHILSELSSIIIPASVKQIGERAFYGRTNLKDVTFEAIENIEIMYADAFEYTAFYESQPDGFIYYEHMLLGYKWDLEYDKYYAETPAPELLSCARKLLGNQGGTTPLEGFVKTPDGITYIGRNAFSGQKNLTKIIISEGVQVIDHRAFISCDSLTEVILPGTLEYVDKEAFVANPALSIIYYNGESEAWEELKQKSGITPDKNYFGDPFSNATVYFYSEEATTEAGNFWHYVDGVPTPWN